MSSSALAKAASIGAAVAVLSTLGAGGTALAVRMNDSSGREANPFPDGQQVSAGAPESLKLTVPPKKQGWEVPSSPMKLTYEGGSGSVDVQGLALYEKAYCTPKYSSSDDQETFLGVVGTLSAPTADDLKSANTQAAESLGAAMNYQMAKSHEVPDAEYGETTLADGSAARTATFSVEPTGDVEDCVNPELSVSIYTVDSGGRYAHVVGIWDSQGSGSLLSDSTVQDILGTTDPS